jgi:hypothetical protein
MATPGRGVAKQATVKPAPDAETIQQLPMVGWYDPRQLLRSGIQVAISTLFGRHSDHRLVEALATEASAPKFYDYTCHYRDDGTDLCEPDVSRPRNSIWIDYVADVGDGWNSTYEVARRIAQPTLSLQFEAGEKIDTQSGSVLIFGGDQVYPVADRNDYQTRLVTPYEVARRNSFVEPPHVFAIPGNHDWYDSLVAFTRLFTTQRWFAGWRTRQSRSYFALKLPHNWWLLGTDMQLGSDIDGPQVAYFQRLVDEMEAERVKTGKTPRIIMCHAEPHWIHAALYGDRDSDYSESNLKLLEKRLGRRVAVFIAGDLHHYRRHEAKDQSVQKITAGGGGAFLHPTHSGRLGVNLDQLMEDDADRLDHVFERKGTFPPPEKSAALCWYNLVFPLLRRNASRTFGLATGLLYWLLTIPVIQRIDDSSLRLMHLGLGSIAATAIQSNI